MQVFWNTLSLLGDCRLLLPLAAVLICVGAQQRQAWAHRWCLALITAGLLSLTTKIAFLGWGVGIARLDFTGLSGHAVMAAAVWPTVFQLAAPDRRTAPWAMVAGLLLASIIAYSRLPLNAHSWSEVIGGWFVGAAASMCTSSALRHSSQRLHTWVMLLGLAVGFCIPLAFPRIHTHEIVVQLAKTLARSEREFNRSSLGR